MFEEKRIQINGIGINYKITGEGKPLLILHGWGRGSDGYIEVQEKFAEAGYKVFMPDLPGFGKTVPPQTAWGVDEYAAFALSFADAVGLQDFILFGHSFGGQVAVKVVLLQPARVQKMILCAAAVIRRKPSMRKQIFMICVRAGNVLFSFWPFFVFQGIARKALYRLAGIGDFKYSQGIMKKVREKVLRQDLSLVVSAIQIPTLIVWGDQDTATLVQDAYILKEKIPNSVLEIIPGTGHQLYTESPERFSEIVVKFLRS